MPKYYVIDAHSIDCFHYDHVAVEARDAESAASEYGGNMFEDGADWERPIDVVVAEDQHGKNARRYTVRRRQEITDEVIKSVDIDIPPKTDEET